jgi:hypothetical protein
MSEFIYLMLLDWIFDDSNQSSSVIKKAPQMQSGGKYGIDNFQITVPIK